MTTQQDNDLTVNGPVLWNHLLSYVHEHLDKDAVIAGGAIRDFVLGIEPRDIDIFVNVDRKHLEAWCDVFHEDWDLGLLDPGDQGNYAVDADWHPETNCVLDGHVHVPRPGSSAYGKSWSVQIISRPIRQDDLLGTYGENLFATYGEALVNEIDIGLCEIFYDEHKAQIMKTQHFDYDLVNHRMTIIRQSSAAGVKASVNRVERIMARLNENGRMAFKWRNEPEPAVAENKL